MIELDKLNSYIDRKIDKPLRGISLNELYDVAGKLKIASFIEDDRIAKVREGAELFFQNRLRDVSKPSYELYMKLREGNIPEIARGDKWAKISEIIDEKKVKEEYISSYFEVLPETDGAFIKLALRQILDRKLRERAQILEKHAFGLDTELAEHAIDLILDIESRANQILYPGVMENSIFSSCKIGGKSLNFLYFVCLRFKHADGDLDVVDDLQPFRFVDINGKNQTRDGSSKLFQLDTVIELANSTKNLPAIRHKIIIADFDMYKFGEDDKSMILKCENYTQAVREYVCKRVDVVGGIDFFNGLGFDKNSYPDIYKSIYRNDGRFVPKLEVERTFQSYKNELGRTVRNWGKERNLVYTSHSLAMNLVQGNALANTSENFVCGVFNKRIKVGEEFSRISAQNIPFIALPIFPDNIGGIEYA